MVVYIAACEGKPCIQQLYILYTTGYDCAYMLYTAGYDCVYILYTTGYDCAYMLCTTGYDCAYILCTTGYACCILQVTIEFAYCILQVMIVLELLVNGDLRNYLIKNRPRYLTLDIKCYLSAASIVQCMHY